jgi:hypothetical protein
MSFNRWNYVDSNPIVYIDPSGHIKEGAEAREADVVLSKLADRYGVYIQKDWGDLDTLVHTGLYVDPSMGCEWMNGNWRSVKELKMVLEAINRLSEKLGGSDKFKSVLSHTSIARQPNSKDATPYSPPGVLSVIGDVVMTDYLFDNGENYAKFTTVHELGHVWNYRTGNQLSHNMMLELGTWFCPPGVGDGIPDNRSCWFPYGKKYDPSTGQVISPELPPGTLNNSICISDPTSCEFPYESTYGGFPLLTGPGAEDWANALAYYVFPNYRKGDVIGLGSIRRQYVQKQISNIH